MPISSITVASAASTSRLLVCGSVAGVVLNRDRSLGGMPFMPRIKTERAWLDSTTPNSLLLTLKGKRLPRQRRLFAVACCRRWLQDMLDPESQDAVEVAERSADGLADQEELEATYRAAQV